MALAIYLTIIIYFAILLAIGLKTSRAKTTFAYWLNNRSSGLWLLTFSHVTSIVFAGSVVGVVTAVYGSGISFAISAGVASVLGMLILAAAARKVYSVPEQYRYTLADIFEWRYGLVVRSVIKGLLVIILFIMTAVNIIAIAQVGSITFGFSYNIFLLLSLAVVILYTAFGGIQADIFTDFIQFWVMMILLVVMLVFGAAKGNFSSVAQLPKSYFNPFAFGGVGFFLGTILLGGFVSLMNSATWQRTFTAKTKDIGVKSLVLSVPFMILISVIIAILGLFAAATLGSINPDYAFYTLIQKLLPPWLIGLGVVGVASISLDSIDSLLIGCSTIISRWRQKSNATVKSARLTTLALGAVATAIAFLFPSILYLSMFGSFLMLAIMPAFLFGLYSKKATGKQAMLSIISSITVLIICCFFMYKVAFIPAVLVGIAAFFIPLR